MKGLAIAVLCDQHEHPLALLRRLRIVVLAQKPEATGPVVVHEPTELVVRRSDSTPNRSRCAGVPALQGGNAFPRESRRRGPESPPNAWLRDTRRVNPSTAPPA